MPQNSEKTSPTSDIFKECTMCGFKWHSRDIFLEDPEIETIGYQVDFTALESGLYLFNHTCGTTLAILVDNFSDLHNGPIYLESLNGKPECPGHCLHENELNPCPNQCKNSYVRDLLIKIKNWSKSNSDKG